MPPPQDERGDMRNKRSLLPGLILVLLVGSACGQPNAPSTTANAAALVAASADATSDAGTARMSLQMTMSMPEGAAMPQGGELTMNAEGAYDFANRLGEMSMTMELPEEAGPMAGPQNIEMVFDDLVIYMKYPFMSQMAPGAKPWIKMDLEELGKEAGVDFGSMMQSGTSDPSQMLEWLRGVSGDVQVVGEEDVRGAPATHYAGTIDFNKVADQAPAEVRDQMKASIDMMTEAIGTSTVPFDVWIDDQGRAVRLQQAFEFKQGATQGASMSMTVDIFDFGTEVDIEVPPPSQTSDFSELMGSMSGSSTSSGSATSSP